MRLSWLVVLGACGKGDSKPPPPAAPPPHVPMAAAGDADAPSVDAAVDPLRKFGFATRELCIDPINHALDVATRDPEWRNRFGASQSREQLFTAQLAECEREYWIGQLDCLDALTSVDDYLRCLSVGDFAPGFMEDVGDAPGHPTIERCTALIDHLATLHKKRYSAKVRAEGIADCRRWVRPVFVDCMIAAPTIAASDACNVTNVFYASPVFD